MNIDDAARATRKYIVLRNMACGFVVIELGAEEPVTPDHSNRSDAEDLRDRLNLIAVLEAIREPSEAMVDTGHYSSFGQRETYQAMIDALIAEVGK